MQMEAEQLCVEICLLYTSNFTHMKARLETGRTHQIRVHALSINHPLLGDEVYGPKNNKFKLKGQILHAKDVYKRQEL